MKIMSSLMNIPYEVMCNNIIPFGMKVMDARLMCKQASLSFSQSDLNRIKFYNIFTDMFLSFLVKSHITDRLPMYNTITFESCAKACSYFKDGITKIIPLLDSLEKIDMKIMYENVNNRKNYYYKINPDVGTCFNEATNFAFEREELNRLYRKFIQEVLCYGSSYRYGVCVIYEKNPLFLEKIMNLLPKRILTLALQNKSVVMNLHYYDLLKNFKTDNEKTKQFLSFPIGKESDYIMSS